jgi:hypothetical protein
MQKKIGAKIIGLKNGGAKGALYINLKKCGEFAMYPKILVGKDKTLGWLPYKKKVHKK